MRDQSLNAINTTSDIYKPQSYASLANAGIRAKVDRLGAEEPIFSCFSGRSNTKKYFYSGQSADGIEGAFGLRYRIKVWGPFDLRSHDGKSCRPSVRKSCALLAILALSDGHRQSRRWLQAQLWSESDEAKGASSLRQELARLKRLLGNAIQSDRFDIWLDEEKFEFDHLDGKTRSNGMDLLQGIDIADEAFEDWLREQRQYYSNCGVVSDDTSSKLNIEHEVGQLYRQPGHLGQKCTVIFDCDAKGSLEANVAAMFFSEQLYRKLDQYEMFTCIGHDTGSEGYMPLRSEAGAFAVVIRIAAFANRDEVCLGVQVDSRKQGPRLGYESVVLPHSLSRLQESPEIGRLVQSTVDTVLDRMKFENLPTGGAAEAMLLANEARKRTFALDKKSLIRADLLLTRAYEIEPRGQYIGWRAFLRNTAFFQHRTSDIFEERYGSDELSLEALHQSPNDAIVQAFSSQLEYVNQGNLVEPLMRAERAVEIDRSDPLARALLSNALTVNGHLEDAYHIALQSVSLAAGSRYEFYFHHFACMAATAARKYELALRHARRSVSFVPDFVSPRRYEVALAMHLGDGDGVEKAVTAMRNVEPGFDSGMLLDPSYPVNTLRRLPIIEAIQ